MRHFRKLIHRVTVRCTMFCFCCFVVPVMGLLFTSCAALGQVVRSIPEHIEWTWEVRPTQPDSKLPNVLLLGDSITKNYFPDVTRRLAGVANVYLMASSISVGDPRLSREIAEFAAMEDVRFSIVHFNNGMHGWGYSEAQFREGFPLFLRAVERLVKSNRQLIWATITPVKLGAPNGATNARIDARNRIAAHLVGEAGISVDRQHALMMKHADLHSDAVHFNAQGQSLQGEQVARSIEAALKSTAQK